MSEDPIAVADQRLAVGEIDLAEHDRITSLIRQRRNRAAQGMPSSAPGRSHVKPSARARADRVATPAASDPTVKIVLGVLAVIVVLILIGINSASSDGLSVGQLSSENGRISMKIANRSSRSGDVLLYVQYDGINKCEHIVELRANGNITNLSFPCEVRSSNGKFHVRYAWASTVPEMTAIAERIKVDW